MPQGPLQSLNNCARQLEALAIPHTASAISDRITISLGLRTLIPSPPCQLQDLMRQADAALYEAKHQGRDRYIQYATPPISTPLKGS